MSFLDKVMFWKREEPEQYPTGLDKNNPALTPQDLGLPQEQYAQSNYAGTFNPPFQQPNVEPTITATPMPQPQIQQNLQPYSADKLELISAKLDTLKALLDSLNQRMTNLEQSLRQDSMKRW